MTSGEIKKIGMSTSIPISVGAGLVLMGMWVGSLSQEVDQHRKELDLLTPAVQEVRENTVLIMDRMGITKKSENRLTLKTESER